MPLQKTSFKYDKKPSSGAKGTGKRKESRPGRREEANMAEAHLVTEFNYMVQEQTESEEVLLASIPNGYGIIDTGCTTSVIGSEVARDLQSFLATCGMPPPELCVLPPAELKGFAGQKTVTTEGIRWHVQLGKLWGTITTYLIPGKTPFLVSRRVLEGMGAVLNLGKRTITSEKHGYHDTPLMQAANGHLLLPLVAPSSEWSPIESKYEPKPHSVDVVAETDCHQDCQEMTSNPVTSCEPEVKARVPTSSHARKAGHTHSRNTVSDKQRSLQHIARNTKNGQVDVDTMRDELCCIFGSVGLEISHAFIAYRPKKERVPETATSSPFHQAFCSLTKGGDLTVGRWSRRTPGPRAEWTPENLVLFAYRPDGHLQDAEHSEGAEMCWCCASDSESHAVLGRSHAAVSSLETLYEETDWTDIATTHLPDETMVLIEENLRSIKRSSMQMSLSRLSTDPEGVQAELQQWLGDQAWMLDKKIDLVEVFTDVAPLAREFERRTGNPVIRIGLAYGHDLNQLAHRRLLLLLIGYVRPRHVWYSFPCGSWGPWSRFNMSRSQKAREAIEHERSVARRHLRAVSECWALQTELGGHSHAENPQSSEAWRELDIREVYEVCVHQCALGLRCPKTNQPVKKPTRLVTTCVAFAQAMQTFRCDRQHNHAHLEGKFRGRNLTSYAEVYPKKFCREVAKCLLHVSEDVRVNSVEELFADLSDDIPDVHDLDVEPEEPTLDAESASSETQRAVALVRKLHVNTGHASTMQMHRLAIRCKASEAVKRAIKNFKCAVCDSLKQPVSHRKTTMPHAERPNDIVGVDFVQVELKREDESGVMQEIKFNVLTCVCLATDFAQQIIVPPGGDQMASALHAAWVRPYGAPRIVYCDPDFTSLSRDFQRYLVHHNIQLLHCGAESHWQLGRVETANRILRGIAQRIWKTSDRPQRR